MTYADLICRFSAGAELPGAHTPPVVAGEWALSYMRLTPAEAEAWRATEGVTVLAEGADPDATYAALFSDPEAAAAYAAIYPREPWVDEDGSEYLPPERIGQVG
jgi:hypothetical protein